MQDKIYLLSIAELLESESGAEKVKLVFKAVDENRKHKAEKIRQPIAKAACLGAGLLLQAALKDALIAGKDSSEVSRQAVLVKCNLTELLESIKEPLPLEFVYGENGKPYLKDYPFYFNLSHSGEYVICAISREEVGVDIQEHKVGKTKRLAERFFCKEERLALAECGGEHADKMFFDLWAKKEAYGKLTGAGITETLNVNMSENFSGGETKEEQSEVIFGEYGSLPGYSIVICKRRKP